MSFSYNLETSGLKKRLNVLPRNFGQFAFLDFDLKAPQADLSDFRIHYEWDRYKKVRLLVLTGHILWSQLDEIKQIKQSMPERSWVLWLRPMAKAPYAACTDVSRHIKIDFQQDFEGDAAEYLKTIIDIREKLLELNFKKEIEA